VPRRDVERSADAVPHRNVQRTAPAREELFLARRGHRDEDDVRARRGDRVRDFPFDLGAEKPVLRSRDDQPRELASKHGDRAIQHVFGRAETEDAVPLRSGPLEQAEHQVDPGDAFGQRPSEQSARPHQRHAVGEDDVGGEHVGAQPRVASHIHDFGGVDYADLEGPSRCDDLIHHGHDLVHRDGRDRHPEQLADGLHGRGS
jgi:hypothetical protein